MKRRQLDRDGGAPALWLQALLQAGLGLMLLAALLPLVNVAGQLGERVGQTLHSFDLDPIVALLVYAIGGAFAARLSATLAGRPWDGLGASSASQKS